MAMPMECEIGCVIVIEPLSYYSRHHYYTKEQAPVVYANTPRFLRQGDHPEQVFWACPEPRAMPMESGIGCVHHFRRLKIAASTATAIGTVAIAIVNQPIHRLFHTP